MKSFDYLNGKFLVSFKVPGPEFNALLVHIKNLPGRYFDTVQKMWVVPGIIHNYSVLKALGFTPSEKAENLFFPKQAVVIPPTPLKDIDQSLISPLLRPYQIEGVKFLEAVDGRGIVAFEPRLGKSSTALAWCDLHPDKFPVVIVGPASSKIGWEREVAKWTKDRSIVLYGRKPHVFSHKVKYIIINYDILWDWVDYLLTLKPQVLIIDEVQCIANKKSKVKDNNTGKTVSIPVKRTESVLKLGKKAKHVISLSGTPITKSPSQFYNCLNLTDPKTFPNRYAYLNEFCNPKQTPWGTVYEGVTNVDKLRSLITPIMIRKRKVDVFTDLPDVDKIIVPLEVDADKYKEEAKEYEEWFKDHADASDEEITRRMNLIKSISYDAKRTQIHEWIRDFIDSGEKLVVFVYHRDVAEDIYKKFKKEAVLVYGGMTVQKRQECIDFFQKDSIFKVFVGQINSTNTAISLSAADTVAFVELPMTPGDLKQAEERIFMPGDGKKRVCYNYLVAGSTVDEDRAVSLQKKALTMNLVLDGEKGEEIFGQNIKKDIRKGK